MLNSSLGKYSEVTLCARFLTYHFSTPPDGVPFQTIIAYGTHQLLGSYVAKPCDQRYQGCTERYKEKLETQQWIQAETLISRD